MRRQGAAARVWEVLSFPLRFNALGEGSGYGWPFATSVLATWLMIRWITTI
jgi:hypothetical protein